MSRFNPFASLHKSAHGAVFPAPWRKFLLGVVEIPILLSGLVFGILVRLMPASFFIWSHSVVLRWLSGARRAIPDGDTPRRVEQSRALYSYLKRRYRREPAILCVISHPPLGKETLWLNFEMISRAFEAITTVKGRASKPRIVVAIDELATGFAGLAGGCLYSGGMHAMHLGVDRIPHTKGYLKGLLLAGAKPQLMPWRIIKQLRSGGEVIIALSGGLPETGRAVYIIREFISSLKKSSGVVDPCLWFSAEEKLFLLSREPGHDGKSPSESGVVSERMVEFVKGLFSSLGCTEGEATVRLAGLKADFARETAFRERFFNFLLRRIDKENVPLLLMGLTHGFPGPSVRLCEAVSNSDVNGELELLGGGTKQFLQTFKRWVESNFR